MPKDVNLSTTSIMRILDKVSLGMKHLPTYLAIDEFIGNAQGEKFQTLLTNPTPTFDIEPILCLDFGKLFAAGA